MSKTKGTKNSPEFLTAAEVARWLRVPKSTLYKLCQEGQIPATKIGRHWRFNRDFVEQWLRERMAHRVNIEEEKNVR